MKEIELLEKYLSDERKEKIGKVLGQRTRDVCIVVDRLDKDHNYMAILRTMEAFGVQDAHIIPLHEDDTQKISKRITKGSHKWLTIKTYPDWQKCFKHLKKQGYKIYASFLSDEAEEIESLDLSGKVALLFGNELNGLDKEEANACDGVFMIPMVGFTQSFNVSVACALTLQRFFMERKSKNIDRGSLEESEAIKLKALWYKRAVPNSAKILKEELKRLQQKQG